MAQQYFCKWLNGMLNFYKIVLNTEGVFQKKIIFAAYFIKHYWFNRYKLLAS